MSNNQSGSLTTAEAFQEKFNRSVMYDSMTEDQARLFLTITVAKSNGNTTLKKELGQFVMGCQSCLIMKTRFKLMDIEVENELLVILSSLIDRPGLAVLSVIDILNVMGPEKTATFDHFVKAYPMGYYNLKDEVMMRGIINLCKDRKINYSEIY